MIHINVYVYTHMIPIMRPTNTCLKMGQTRPLFVYFHSFHNAKSNVVQI